MLNPTVKQNKQKYLYSDVHFELRRFGAARVEVLLRQMALKPKASASGDLLKGDGARSTLFSIKRSRGIKIHRIGGIKWNVNILDLDLPNSQLTIDRAI